MGWGDNVVSVTEEADVEPPPVTVIVDMGTAADAITGADGGVALAPRCSVIIDVYKGAGADAGIPLALCCEVSVLLDMA